MENIFLTKLDIKSVRHLHGIEISLSDTVRKHLILTGKNGSGKTSTLESLKEHLEFIISDQYVSYEEAKRLSSFGQTQLAAASDVEKWRGKKYGYVRQNTSILGEWSSFLMQFLQCIERKI